MKRFYYSDGSVSDGEPKSPLGIIAILQKNEEGEWHVRTQGDFYVQHDGVWVEVDLFGLIDYALDKGLVLAGRMTSNSRFAEIMKRAMDDLETME